MFLLLPYIIKLRRIYVNCGIEIIIIEQQLIFRKNIGYLLRCMTAASLL